MRNEVQGRARAILIAGPTASGKSGLAVSLARRFGGHVINADSMQVYRDLAILTARPTAAETAAAPHALYGTIDGAATYSVSRWLADVSSEISRAESLAAMPILVGGTGLYFKALTQGLSDIPPVPDDVRAEVRAAAKGKPVEVLHEDLRGRDPATAALLRPTDPQRILRALEVHAATGESLSYFQGRRTPPLLAAHECVALSLTLDRDLLRSRIDTRFDRMMTEGALEEVARLAARRLDPALPVMRAIGVPPLLQYLAGGLSRDEAVGAAKAASRQYVKRQETFVRHQLTHFRPVTAESGETEVIAMLQS